MKKLVVFYSLEGNTRMIAETLAEAAGADRLELKLKEVMSPRKLIKYAQAGVQAWTGKKPELEPFEKNPADYDLIFIGTPVWAFSYTPPLKTFFRDCPLTGKKIALFCCYRSIKGKVFEKMRKQLTANEILGEIAFPDPARKETVAAKRRAAEWIKRILDKAGNETG